MKHSQTHQISRWLRAGRSITPIQALEKFGCFRLSARIDNLRKAGLHIVTDTVRKNGKSFARYSLANPCTR